MSTVDMVPNLQVSFPSSRSNESPISSGLPIVYLQQGSQVKASEGLSVLLPTYDLRCCMYQGTFTIPVSDTDGDQACIRLAACAASNAVLSSW